MDWIKQKIEDYYSWLRDSTTSRKDEEMGWYAISTPFLGQFNDSIEIFVKQEGENILLSDDGETIANLSVVGVDLYRSPKRKEFLRKTLLNYGITDNNGELCCTATASTFAMRKHALLSAIIELSSLDVLAKSSVSSVFFDDVHNYLEYLGVLYTANFIAHGKSGLDFTFDFQITGRKEELLIKTFPTVKQNNVGNYLFSINDVKNIRTEQSGKMVKNLAIINDADVEPQKRLVEAFASYDTSVLLWSKKEEHKEVFNVA